MFYSLLACMYFRYMPSMIVGLPLVLISFATGLLSLFAFAFRGATTGTARFSLRGLLIVMTVVAVGLGAAVVIVRGL